MSISRHRGQTEIKWIGMTLGLLLFIYRSAIAQSVEYIHTDALGTPVAVTDADRNVLETSEYEPFGKLLNRPLTDEPGYTGHVSDAATGLSYMQQRYYDPGIGRLLSVDPVTADGDGGNFNRYTYVANNPYRSTDPDGREPVDDMEDATKTKSVREFNSGSMDKLSGDKAFRQEASAQGSGGATANLAPNVKLREGVQLKDNIIRDDLQALSDSVGGKDIDVISGYRSQEKQDGERAAGNKRAAKSSQHTRGRAADIKIKGMSQREIGKAALDLGRFERVNVYSEPSAGVHIDYLDVGKGTQMYNDWKRTDPP